MLFSILVSGFPYGSVPLGLGENNVEKHFWEETRSALFARTRAPALEGPNALLQT